MPMNSITMFSLGRRTNRLLMLLYFMFACYIWFIIDDRVTVTFRYYTVDKNWRNRASVLTTLNGSDPVDKLASVSNLTENGQELYDRYGYNISLADMLPLDRSIHDTRHEDCKKITYLSKLPKSAIIVTFYNERLSTLLRTVYSIINRTPKDLIQEIILVDDGSNWPDLHASLDDFLQRNLPPDRSKVRLLRLPKRNGIMVARMMGARNASKASEVLIFLDAHLEMMYNWLPPLLEPIVLNSKTCTVPSLDFIDSDTLAFKSRVQFYTYFTRYLGYRLINLRGHEVENFRDYVMFGCAMAIRADYFWQLGGFDEGMLFWGYEQFEFSFKIWMCGGELINVPCSRMGHIFRDLKTKGNQNLYGNYTFLNRNIRRVIDVWLDDEHRQHVFDYNPDLAFVDPGDLSRRIAIRNSLKCKNFRWMLENIMPVMRQDTFGNGTICSFHDPELCIAYDQEKQDIVLSKSKIKNWNHFWFYSLRCDFHDISSTICFDGGVTKGKVKAFQCHFMGGNQEWFYHSQEYWIVHKIFGLCISANVVKNKLDLVPCVTEDLKMKWLLETYNKTAIEQCRKI